MSELLVDEAGSEDGGERAGFFFEGGEDVCVVPVEACAVGATACRGSRGGDGDVEDGEEMHDCAFEERVVFEEVDFEHYLGFGV